MLRHLALAAVLAGMVRLPAGTYEPVYRRAGEGQVRVAAFALDAEPATNAEYLAFVRANPAWRRSTVKPVYAERDYLAAWGGDLDAGGPTAARRPVTAVSWFAAKAQCAWRGKRLPTVDEWEYAAAASRTRRDAARDPGFVRHVLALYTRRSARAERGEPNVGAGAPNAYGVRDLHELTWEWTLDFNGVLVSDDSREGGSGVVTRDHDLFCAGAAVGATDPTNYPAFMRYAARAGLTGRSTLRTLGVRCAADLPGT